MKLKSWHFFLLVFTFLIFLASGFGFKAGTMIASADKIIDNAIIENFYSSSWSVYTTIFGLLGIVLGVVFPIYQSNQNGKVLDKRISELDQKIIDLSNTKKDIYKGVKNNAILLEIQKIQNKFSNQKNDKEKEEVLIQLQAFINDLDFDNSKKLLSYFNHLTHLLNRDDVSTASEITHLTESIVFHNNFTKTEKSLLLEDAVQIGYSLVYDTCLSPPYINEITYSGLQLLKEVYYESKKLKFDGVMTEIRQNYNAIFKLLEKRITNNESKHNSEYVNALNMIKYLLNDLDNNERGVSFYKKPTLEKLLNRIQD